MMKAALHFALSGLFLTGCVSTMDRDGAMGYSELRDVNNPDTWIGATKDELMTAMGPPKRAIHSQGPDGQPTYNYIYAKGDGSDSCIATYLIEKSSGTVIEYSCY